MPSCSVSSNIQGTSTVLSPTASGNRLSMRLLYGLNGEPNGYTLEGGITTGSVIRYKPANRTYYLSQANNNENAEVVGVVENKDDAGIDVVLRGLINYTSTLYDIDSGGSGGSDIWFLSGDTAGAMQSVEPDVEGYIAKPVMQSVATSDGYNYQVLNYIGYSIGAGELSNFDGSRLPVGSSMIVETGVEVPKGWIDATTSQEVLVSEYPDYYAYAGKENGYVEKITMDPSTSVVSSYINKPASQKTAGIVTNSSRVLRVSTADNEIYVRRIATSEQIDTTKSVYINNVEYTPTDSTVYSIFTPKITANKVFSFYQGSTEISKQFKVIYKIRDINTVNIPRRLTVKELDVTESISASNGTETLSDLVQEIIDLKNRVDALENRVIGIS